MFYVYILQSQKDGRLYKGLTGNLTVRLQQHNQGENRSTKGFRPWKLLYHEEFGTRAEARAREQYFKSGVGREYLRELLGYAILPSPSNRLYQLDTNVQSVR